MNAREPKSGITRKRNPTFNKLFSKPETASRKTPNNGAEAQNKYVALQFSKYCCSGDLVESQSTLMTWAESASAIGELTAENERPVSES